MTDSRRSDGSTQGNGHAGQKEERALARRELKRALTRARTSRERLELLIGNPHADALVPTMPAEELYFTIKDVGLSDALELVHLASPGQFRTFLDLDAWKRDRLETSVALQWLRAARTDSDDERYRRKLDRLDLEVIELLMKSTLTIHDLEEDDDPELQGNFHRSPEGRYIVEFNVEGADYMGIKALLDDIYAEDPARAARMLEAVRWELPTELEEVSLRWRTARLSDLGFPDLAEALAYFAFLDPDSALPNLERSPAVPEGFFLSRMQQAGLFFDEAARRIPDAARDVVERQLVTVLNAVMVVDSVDPGDSDAVARALSSARDTLSLGLEHAAKGDPDAGAALLTTAPLKRVFQVGASLALKLKFRADRLVRAGRVSFPSIRDATLLDAPAGDALFAVRRKRPQYPVSLDDPSAPPERLRTYRDRADVARVAQLLEQAEQIADIMGKLGFDAARAEEAFAAATREGLAFLRFSDLLLTAAARAAAGESFAFEPVPRARVGELGARLFRIEAGEPVVVPEFRDRVRGAIQREAAALSEGHVLAGQAFSDLCLGRLLDEAGRPFAAAGRIDPELPLPFVVR